MILSLWEDFSSPHVYAYGKTEDRLLNSVFPQHHPNLKKQINKQSKTNKNKKQIKEAIQKTCSKAEVNTV